MGIAERREREKEQRRNNIIDAAEKIIFTKGFDEATMDEVAETAELSKGTLYLYFKSKTELYYAIINRGMEIMFNMFHDAYHNNEKGMCRIKAIGASFIEFYRTHPNYFKAFLDDLSNVIDLSNASGEEAKNLPFKKKSMELLIYAIGQGIKEGEISDEIDPKKTAVMLWAHLTGVLQMVESKKSMINKFFEVETDELIDYHFYFTMRALTK